ncbi:MAG: hydrogenase maturation protease [Pirellulales bacterium]
MNSLPQTLIAGYGNVWRGDDGVGPAVVERLKLLLPPSSDSTVRCVGWRQLMPEHALECRGINEIWLIDASVDLSPGRVGVRRVRAAAGSVVADPFSHRWSPALLLQLAQQLNGVAPRTKLYTIGVGQLTTGDAMSPEAARAVEQLARHLARRLARRRAFAPR